MTHADGERLGGLFGDARVAHVGAEHAPSQGQPRAALSRVSSLRGACPSSSVSEARARHLLVFPHQ
jgi:hypothetical protein